MWANYLIQLIYKYFRVNKEGRIMSKMVLKLIVLFDGLWTFYLSWGLRMCVLREKAAWLRLRGCLCFCRFYHPCRITDTATLLSQVELKNYITMQVRWTQYKHIANEELTLYSDKTYSWINHGATLRASVRNLPLFNSWIYLRAFPQLRGF